MKRAMALTVLAAADLHLCRRAPERDYSLAVLAEVLHTADDLSAAAVILCGDLFDSFADLEALRDDVRRLVGTVEARVIFVPGNHEQLERGGRSFSSFDLGRVEVAAGEPFALMALGLGEDVVELLTVPHQADYSAYRDWTFPPKRARQRLLAAHGTVLGMSYAGREQEDGGAVIDPDLFCRAQADFVLLGHVHARPPELQGSGFVAAYCGSARVWRRGESGPRGGLVLEWAGGGAPLSARFVPFATAGQYRLVELPLGLDGSLAPLAAAASWGQADDVELNLRGLVDDEQQVVALERELERLYKAQVRELTVRRDDVMVLAGVHSEPVARRFVALWEARQPPLASPDFADWLAAREIGLRELKAQLERRR